MVNKIVLTKDLIELLGIPKKCGLSKVESVTLIREMFSLIINEVESVDEGRATIQGLGVFIVRIVEMNDGSTVRRVVFK